MNSEHQEQAMFLKWFMAQYRGILIHSVPNGGNRNIVTAKKLKDEGATAGIPDLFVPKYNLWIEMKKEKGGVLSKVQKDIISYLENEAGHTVIIGYGAMDAASKVKDFMNGRYKRGAYKKVNRVCENCGASFSGTSKSRFCSNRCRVADFRKKYKKVSSLSCN